jgi:pilus assembly protein Flp/PilA
MIWFVIYLIQVLNIERNKIKKLVGGNKMLEKMKNLVMEEEGQALTEYGLIIGLIAAVCIAALILLGGQIGVLFDRITAALTGAGVTPTAPTNP